jgi:dienelactone hydrolase
MSDGAQNLELTHGSSPRDNFTIWRKLNSGPHATGFRLTCRHDFSRLYPLPLHDECDSPRAKQFRPILQAMWYPAHRSESDLVMPYRDYFAVDNVAAGFHQFLRRLFDFNLNMASQYGLLKPLAELGPEEQNVFEAWLNTPTTAIRNAPAATGRFPLVIYHAGLGSSYEDNALFCEYLASHGYIVLSSAFQAEDASKVGLNGDFERSARDVQFLLNSLQTQPNVDLERVAVMGHSFGGHTASALRGLTNSPMDAVVSLDSTMEYFPSDDEKFAAVRQRLHSERHTVPMLLFSGMRQFWFWTEGSDDHVVKLEPPFFDSYNHLPHAQRYYATVRDVEHSDFVAQGAWLGRNRHALQGKAAHGEKVWDTFEAICLIIHQFLDAVLKQDAAAAELLRQAAQHETTEKSGASAISLRIEDAVPVPTAP